MTPFIRFLVCASISVIFLSCLFWRINQDWKERFDWRKHGPDRAEQRKMKRHWNSDRNKDVEKIPFESPLSEGKSHPGGLPGQALDNLSGTPEIDVVRAPQPHARAVLLSARQAWCRGRFTDAQREVGFMKHRTRFTVTFLMVAPTGHKGSKRRWSHKQVYP
jgi:hypothetical protein